MTKELIKYNSKRNFEKTKEPIGKIKKSTKKLKFVIQHHLASTNHYDFRLEWNGTLKSWAVPKGPTYNPDEKRLAVQVEDHPVSYRNFEGVIPLKQYGGGIVMLWDEGTWEPLEEINKNFDVKSFKFSLSGKRLKGEWSLVHMKDNHWLLIKVKDDFSKLKYDIKKIDTSIRSNRTMKQIASDEAYNA